MLGRLASRLADRSPDAPGLAEGEASRIPTTAASLPRWVVVGGGMAAQRFIERLSSEGHEMAHESTLLTDEVHLPYDRVHLGSRLEGRSARSLVLRDEEWYVACGVRLGRKERVDSIDRARRVLVTSSGAEPGYDRLGLATGGEPLLPPETGIDSTRSRPVALRRTWSGSG